MQAKLEATVIALAFERAGVQVFSTELVASFVTDHPPNCVRRRHEHGRSSPERRRRAGRRRFGWLRGSR